MKRLFIAALLAALPLSMALAGQTLEQKRDAKIDKVNADVARHPQKADEAASKIAKINSWYTKESTKGKK